MLSNKPLLTRFAFFILLFVVMTGIIGPWIIRTRLLYGFYFFIYGNLGKVLIFGSIAFFLMARQKLKTFRGPRWSPFNFFYLALSQLMTCLFFSLAKNLLKEPNFGSDITLSINTHLTAVSIPLFLFLGIFGLKYSLKFYDSFKKNILVCTLISAVFYFAIFYIWALWPYLSFIVLQSVFFLLKLSFSHVWIVPPLTIIAQGFAVKIEQACSGIDSIFLFSSLYIMIAIIDWKKFNHKKLFLIFAPALAGLFLVNILRVYLLVLIGVLISADLSVKLFHTYLGMVFFVTYFGVFWKVFYSHLKIKPTGSRPS